MYVDDMVECCLLQRYTCDSQLQGFFYNFDTDSCHAGSVNLNKTEKDGTECIMSH